jgi:hypothetical protein
MKFKISRTEAWAASLEDRPGGLADKLAALAQAGANLEFILARRTPERAGHGVVFVTPLKGAKQLRAAKAAGFEQTVSLHLLRVEGTDKKGEGAKVSRALAEAGINLRAISAAAFGKRFVSHLALDSAAAATKATALLKKLK